MKVIQTHIIGKHTDQNLCEDHIEITDDFVLLIDGATSKSLLTFDGKKGGKKAGELLSRALSQVSPAATAMEFVEELTQAIQHYYQSLQLAEHMLKHPTDRITAAIAVYSRYKNEVWLVGDTQCLLDQQVYTNEKRVDQTIADARALYLEMALLQGEKISDLQENDQGRQYVLPLLEQQAVFQNATIDSPYAYGVIDGFPVQRKHVLVIPVKTSYIILASDGYPQLFPTLEETEQHLQTIIIEDPLCYQQLRSTKGVLKGNVSFDDRSWVKIARN